MATPSKLSLEQLTSIASAVEASAAKHVASGRAASASCGNVSPDFSKCPTGFVADGAVCAPSSSYSGYCRAFALGDHSAVELEEAEVFCDFCF